MYESNIDQLELLYLKKLRENKISGYCQFADDRGFKLEIAMITKIGAWHVLLCQAPWLVYTILVIILEYEALDQHIHPESAHC